MPAIGEDMPAICCIPYLHRTIIASRGDALAIGRPGYCIDTGEMSMISIESFAMGGSSGRLGCGDGVALECGGGGKTSSARQAAGQRVQGPVKMHVDEPLRKAPFCI